MQSYENLDVWKRSDALAHSVYDATRQFPTDERYGLQSQIRRSAISIPSNIVEGAARPSQADFARHLGIAIGSAAELEYQVLFATTRGFIQAEDGAGLRADCERVRKMLIALRATVRRDLRAGRSSTQS